MIVRFLAVLELYKQGMVDILQFTNFGELLVRRLQDGESAARRREPRRLGRRRDRRGIARVSVSEPGIPASSERPMVSA